MDERSGKVRWSPGRERRDGSAPENSCVPGIAVAYEQTHRRYAVSDSAQQVTGGFLHALKTVAIVFVVRYAALDKADAGHDPGTARPREAACRRASYR